MNELLLTAIAFWCAFKSQTHRESTAVLEICSPLYRKTVLMDFVSCVHHSSIGLSCLFCIAEHHRDTKQPFRSMAGRCNMTAIRWFWSFNCMMGNHRLRDCDT